MSLIEQETAARRLARAILTDIHLYNSDAVTSRGDLTEQIGEGRGLYRSRVTESLHALFETELSAGTLAGLDRAAPRPAPTTHTPTTSAPTTPGTAFTSSGDFVPKKRRPMGESSDSEGPVQSGSGIAVMLAIALLALGVGVSVLLMR
jgi:hypothetical protein